MWELAASSPVSAIDPSREAVDGGNVFHDVVFAPIVGKRWLERVLKRLGENGYAFLVLVAVHGTGLLDAARQARTFGFGSGAQA